MVLISLAMGGPHKYRRQAQALTLSVPWRASCGPRRSASRKISLAPQEGYPIGPSNLLT